MKSSTQFMLMIFNGALGVGMTISGALSLLFGKDIDRVSDNFGLFIVGVVLLINAGNYYEQL